MVIINKVPKGLKNTYEFLRELKKTGIHIQKTKNGISFKYLVNNSTLSFLIKEDSSDSDVFKQIFIEKEYQPVLSLLKKHSIDVKTCIDAGANVGFTSLYIKQFYPESEIIALEPNNTTFRRLEQNIKINNIEKCQLLNLGLWSHSTYLKGDRNFRDGQDWSFRLSETDSHSEQLFKTISINELIYKANWEYVDFLKIDIEGGEAQLFLATDLNWLNKIKCVAVEIHDEINSRDQIENILRSKKFQLFHSGELTIAIRFNNA